MAADAICAALQLKHKSKESTRQKLHWPSYPLALFVCLSYYVQLLQHLGRRCGLYANESWAAYEQRVRTLYAASRNSQNTAVRPPCLQTLPSSSAGADERTATFHQSHRSRSTHSGAWHEKEKGDRSSSQ